MKNKIEYKPSYFVSKPRHFSTTTTKMVNGKKVVKPLHGFIFEDSWQSVDQLSFSGILRNNESEEMKRLQLKSLVWQIYSESLSGKTPLEQYELFKEKMKVQ